MLKVALLYADRVTLHSLAAALLLDATERATSFTTTERLSLMVRISPLLGPEYEENYRYQLESYKFFEQEEAKLLIARTRYRNLKRRAPSNIKKGLKSARSGKKVIEDKGQKSWVRIDDKLDELRATFGIDKLDKAVAAGRLTVNTLESDKVSAHELLIRLGQENQDIEHLVSEPAKAMTREVMKLMFTPNDFYPFVDDRLGKALRLAKSESKTDAALNRVQKEKAKNVSLASHMFDALPGFEKAAFDEILDISSELARPLIRFRSAVAEYTELVESISWDEDFEVEATKILEEKIKPLVLDIEERVEDNTYLRQLTTQVEGSTARNLLGVLGTALTSNAVNLAEHQAGMLAALGLLSFDAVWAARKKLVETREIQKEKLFFYYKLKVRFHDISS